MQIEEMKGGESQRPEMQTTKSSAKNVENLKLKKVGRLPKQIK